MLIDEIKHISSTRQDLRKFGLTVGIFLLILAAVAFWFGKSYVLYLLLPGLALLLSGLIFPQILKPLQIAWMTLAVIIGWFMNRVILGILFFSAFTLIGLIARLVGKQFLDVKWDTAADSYWHYRKPQPFEKSHYEQQF
ncbi:MAG: hypothetical protein H6628_05900 [Calditrichae bacterium]|nr:hypothetical protein [Calditrichota bacterium]MCB9087823.1 hypothetical protein [Calditrichia bacterium]